MKRLVIAISLGFGLVAAHGAAALAQEAPIVLTNSTGDCTTYGTPGDWTIVCGDINPALGTTLITPPTVATTPAPVTLAPAPAPATEPAPVTTDSAPADATDAASSATDTDGDRVADTDELDLYATDPMLADSDGDGMSDGAELFGSHTDPLVWNDFSASSDTGAADTSAADTTAAAPAAPASAASVDTDADKVADVDEEQIYNTDPTVADTDGDGLTDGEELFAAGTDPLLWDTNGDGIGDAEEANTASADSAAPAAGA